MKPLIHIGFPKTATTWLQWEFFPKVKNINYAKPTDIIEKILKPNTFEIDYNSVKHFFNSNDKRTVICDEILVGGLDACFGNGAFIKETGNRLKQIFEDAEIIIFIRNQKSMVASAYYQYLRAGGNFSATKYLNRTEKCYPFLVKQLLFSYDIFKYDQTITYYKELYGNENVHVYLYEDFKANQKQFLEKFKTKHNFEIDIEKLKIEHKINSRYKRIFLFLVKITNTFCVEKNLYKYHFFNIPKLFNVSHRIYSKLNKYKIFGKAVSDEKLIGKSNIEFIEKYYKKSNQNLIEKHGLDSIKKYQYPL